MKRILPHPLLSVGLFVASILLSASVAPPSIALAVIAALTAPWVMIALRVDPIRIKAPRAIAQLVVAVVADVVRSNWAVAQIILGRRKGERVPGFVHIPLTLRDRYGLAILAIIVTSTPGTLWVEYEATTGSLVLHVLDLVDEEAWVQTIQHRYERRLMEIFE